MQMVVLAGGLGTRLRPYTHNLPKSLVPVNGRSFLEYQLDLFERSGIDDVVLLTGHLGEQIRERIQAARRDGMRVRCCDEGETLLGTGGAVRNAESLLAGEFFLTYGDSYLPIDYAAVMDDFRRRRALGLMVVYRNEDRGERSNVVVEDGFVTIYDKERAYPGMSYINFGISVLRKEALRLIPPGVRYSQEAWYQQLIQARELLAYETWQRYYEVGSIAGLEEFRDLMAPAGAARGKS
jgi:NDP-sugar pyrophosphorylase family protein